MWLFPVVERAYGNAWYSVTIVWKMTDLQLFKDAIIVVFKFFDPINILFQQTIPEFTSSTNFSIKTLASIKTNHYWALNFKLIS